MVAILRSGRVLAKLLEFVHASMGDYFLARHTRAASEEIQELAGEFRILIGKADIPTPALGRL